MLKFRVKSVSMPPPLPKPTSRKHQPLTSDVVDPVWLMKALAATLLAALVCGYLTVCFLFYQGQWQLTLHPVRTASSPSSIGGAPYQLVHFGPDESAVPQLTGWWIPASSGGRYTNKTVLFLSGSEGSLSDATPTLVTLHNLGINIFAFDYRGYGQSAAIHPSQINMLRDTESAWTYLTVSRAIPAQQIIPYGSDIGASLAVSLASTHHQVPAVILDSPRGDLLDVAAKDPRSRLIPVRLLFLEDFPLAKPLRTLKIPKLLLSRTPSAHQAFQTAADPKLIVELASPSDAAYSQTVTRFLDKISVPPPTIPD